MQKKERTPEELKAIRMANLKQNKRKENDNIIPEHLKDFIFPHVKVLLNSAEFFLYCSEAEAWIKDHPEWRIKEDIDDINGIAMEKVIQFRLLSDKKMRKSTDIDKEYTSSKNREMVHRNNLGARRQSRIEDGKRQNITNNVVSIIGSIDDEKLKKIIEINKKEDDEDEKLFPTKVFDVEVIEEENKNGN